jgi:hypothetical protein
VAGKIVGKNAQINSEFCCIDRDTLIKNMPEEPTLMNVRAPP